MSVIKDLRTKYKLSQGALAALVPTSQPQISRLENDERELTKEWAILLAAPLRTTPQFIIFGEDGDGSWQSLLRAAIKCAFEQDVTLTEINAELGALLFSDLADSARQLAEQDPENDATVRVAVEKGGAPSGNSRGQRT